MTQSEKRSTPKQYKKKTEGTGSSQGARSAHAPGESGSDGAVTGDEGPASRPESPSYYNGDRRSPGHHEEGFRDVQIPPLPTVVMPTSGLSSPMTTPLQSPAQFDQFPECLQLHNEDEIDSDHELEDERPRCQYPRLLEQQIKKQAIEARTKRNTHFARLYTIAQTPRVKKKINLILSKKDISHSSKVDCIASLLRAHAEDPI